MRSTRCAARALRAPIIVCGLGLGVAVTACGDAPITETVDPPDTVAAVVASSIEMRPAPQLYVDSLGAVRQAIARAFAKDGSTLDTSADRPDRFSWSSSAPDVARVDQRGVITSVGWGRATITATHTGATGTVRINVRDAVRLAWSVPTMDKVQAGIAIGADGTIYVSSKDRLSAVSPKGTVLWTFDRSSSSLQVLATPAIADNGTLYFGSPSRHGLIAMLPDGTILWERELTKGGTISSSPALGPDGTIYAASNDSLVYAVDPRGGVRWTYRGTDRFFLSSPAVASDGTIYVGGDDGVLHAINPDGSARWQFKAEKQIQSSPSIGSDGTIYFGAFDTRLYAVKPDGTEHWKSVPLAPQSSSFYSSPAIAPDGTIYVGYGGLFAIAPNGSIRWSYGTDGSLQTDVVLGGDGTVYVGGPKGFIYAFDGQGNLQWHYQVVGNPTVGIAGSPAIGVDGTVLAALEDGTLWALVENGSKNGGYAGSPWPKVRGNRANSGRAGVR